MEPITHHPDWEFSPGLEPWPSPTYLTRSLRAAVIGRIRVSNEKNNAFPSAFRDRIFGYRPVHAFEWGNNHFAYRQSVWLELRHWIVPRLGWDCRCGQWNSGR